MSTSPLIRLTRGSDKVVVYYNTAVPMLMMFIISHRLYNAIMQLGVVILWSVLILPVLGIFARNVVGFVRYQFSFPL